MDQENYPSKSVLISMLKFALIEIRASSSIEECKRLADIFHNLPSQLLLDWTDEVAKSAYEKILKRSQRYSVENYILALRKSAEKSVN